MSDTMTRFLSLEEELSQRARQQAAVAQLGQRALVGTDLGMLMDESVVLVAQTLEVEYCKVLELLPGGEALLLRAGVGWTPGLAGEAIVGAGMDSQAGYTLYSGEPVIVDDLSSETRFNGPPLLLEHGVVSGMSVIIQGEQGPFGVLGAHSTRRRSFTRDDVHFLQSVANVLAAAIERKRVEGLLVRSNEALVALNASLERRVAERAGYVRLLQEAAVAANQSSTAEAAFQYVLDTVCAYTGWPVGHVYFQAGEHSGEPLLIHSTLWHLQDPQRFESFRRVTEDTRLPFGLGLPGRVLATGKPAWLVDFIGDTNFPRACTAAETGIRSGFAFPVMIGEEVAAVLEFFSTETSEPDEPLQEVMAHIGTQLGRAVERQRSEQALRHSQEQLAEAQRMAHIGSWDWDIPSDTVHWSEELYRIYGLEPGKFQATYESYLEQIHPQDRELVSRTVEQSIHHHQPFEMEHRVVRPDGQERIIYAQGKTLLDEGGRPVRMVGIALDITERRRMEQALRESLNLLENLFESAPDGTVLVDENGRILRVNRQMEAISGYGRGELLGKPLEILLPERFKERHVLHQKKFSSDPRRRPMGANLELYGLHKDGHEFPVDIMLSPLRTRQGVQVIAVVRDITERRKAEEALRESEARFRSIFESAATGIALVDLDSRILVSNPRLQEILGYTEEELRGTRSSAITHPLDVPATQQLYDDLIAGRRESAQIEKRYIRKDGQVIWGQLTLSLVRDWQGAPQFVIAMIEDITARKQMEAELAEVHHRLMAGREQERMQLAQELHDVPMQDLYVALYQLNDFDEARQDEEAFHALLREQTENLRQVINTLRAICGELRSPTLSPFGLEGAIREHAEQFQAKHPQPRIHLDLMSDDQMLPEDTRLNLFRIYQQALTNVVRHAEAANVTVRFHWDEDQITLEVEDDGRGFEVPRRWIGLAREGHLGLVGAAERAELIGGHFQIFSTTGKGTRVRVRVPRTAE